MKELEAKYNKEPQKYGSFMYYFYHADHRYCIDATQETSFMGRLVNHSRTRPNMKAKV